MTYDFAFFRDGPGQQVCMRLGIHLDGLETWAEFRNFVSTIEDFEQRADSFYSVASSGESALILGVLYAGGAARFADELADGRAWRIMSGASGNYQLALAACIAQIDPRP